VSIPDPKVAPARSSVVLLSLLLALTAWSSGAEGQTVTPDPAAAVTCAYTLGASGASFGMNGDAGSVAVTTAAGCAWTSASNAAWVTITSDSDRTGGGSVTYTVAANTGPTTRSGTLTIAGKTYTVSQAACTYALAATSASFTMNGGSGSVGVTTGNGCGWTSTSGAPWVTITSDSPRTGSGPVSYTVAANSTLVARTATLTIGGKAYKVTQAACTFTLGATGAAFPPTGGSGSVGVTTGDACPWTAASSAAWLTITSGSPGTGSGSVTYAVAANTTGVTRTGALTIGGKKYTVTQATCTYALGATGAPFGVNGGTGSVGVTTGEGCPWTSTSGAPWVTITSDSPRTGSGTVSYTVAANSTLVARTATLTIGGKAYKVTQAACTFTLGATGAAFPPIGGTGSVTVTTGDACAWSNTSSAPWVTITSASSPTGGGTVTYSVAANTTSLSRTARLSIAGKPYTVTQTACAYTVTPASASFPVDGGTGSVTVTTGEGCAWTATSSAAWLTVTSGSAGTGNGSVGYSVAANTTSASRSATLTIAGKAHRVTQTAAASSADLRVTLRPPGESFTGKTFEAPVTVRNAGGVAAAAFDVGVFVSTTSQPGSGMLLRTGRVSQLAPGASVDLNLDLSLPNTLEAGEYFMSAVADVGNAIAQPPATSHTAVVGPFRVGRGVDKFKDIRATIQFSGASLPAGGIVPAVACSVPSSLALSGSAQIQDQRVNADNSVTATGTVTLVDSARAATFGNPGTFTATVRANDSASISLTFGSVTIGSTFSGTAQANAVGSLTFSSGIGDAGTGGGLGFTFDSDPGGFTGTLSGSGCGSAFTGSFKATVDLIFQLFFLHFLDAGSFGRTGLTPAVRFPVPFWFYGVILGVVDRPGTLPAPGQVRFTGPTGSGLNNVAADSNFSLVDQADGFGAYLPPFVTSTTGAPDGTYLIDYKGLRPFEVDIDASQRAVIPFPTVALDAARNLQRVSWQYRHRQTGGVIPPPPFIGLIGVLVSTVNSNGTLDFCSSDFFDRTTTTFVVRLTPDCPAPVRWDNVFSLDFIYVDSLTFSGYGVFFAGPRQSFPHLVVAKVGTGTVTSSPAGISCGTTCTASFPVNATVTLTATPGSGSTFVGWSGACSGTSRTCTVSMTTDKAVVATFGTSSQVRFLNYTCVTAGGSGCSVGYTADLTSSIYESHTWTSFSLVPSAYQTVLSPRLNGFSVYLRSPYNYRVDFSGGDFILTPGHKYTIRLDVNSPYCSTLFCLLLFDTTNSTTGPGILLRQAPVPGSLRPFSVEPTPTAPGP
jgi:hypothetical protein